MNREPRKGLPYLSPSMRPQVTIEDRKKVWEAVCSHMDKLKESPNLKQICKRISYTLPFTRSVAKQMVSRGELMVTQSVDGERYTHTKFPND